MNKTCIAFLTKDRVELTEQSIKPLLSGEFDLLWVDGSDTESGIKASQTLAPNARVINNVRGGAGAALVFALTIMLKGDYKYVGLVENDVLLDPGWYPGCFDLFRRGAVDGLEVGAVSARCFEDRVLFQRDGYAVCHNLGAGMVVFTRQAARLVLDHFRTPWTVDNRRIFSQLCGLDIGSYWAFQLGEHYLTADWGWDATLAAHGLASLALTPSPVEMIGQNPPLAEQGLKIVKEPSPLRADDTFARYEEHLELIREGRVALGVETKSHFDPNTTTWTYFPHQMQMLGGQYYGGWQFEECRGFGTFKWVASPWQFTQTGLVEGEGMVTEKQQACLTVPVFGPCAVLVSGGKLGGKVEVLDEQSGFKASPVLPPEGEGGHVLQMQIPGGINYRNLRITALTPGVCFYGIQTREKQPSLPGVGFDYSVLPGPA